jgi:hypothetical protein
VGAANIFLNEIYFLDAYTKDYNLTSSTVGNVAKTLGTAFANLYAGFAGQMA